MNLEYLIIIANINNYYKGNSYIVTNSSNDFAAMPELKHSKNFYKLIIVKIKNNFLI